MKICDVSVRLRNDSVFRTQTVLALLLLAACAVYLLVVWCAGIETEVIRDRYWKNAVPLFDGTFPVMEYPPLAIVFIAVPRLFASTPWGYETAYVAMVYASVVLGMLAASRLAGIAGYDRSKASVAYFAVVMLSLEFVLDRFDVFPMIMCLGAVLLLLEKHAPAAFALLAAATLVKVYPGALFPLFAVYAARTRGIRTAAVASAVFVAVGAAAAGAFWILDPDTITHFLSYNGGRPLQIESVPASLLYPFSVFGADMWIEGAGPDSFWSDNLRGAIPDAVSGWTLPVTAACVAGTWLAYALGSRGLSSRRADTAFAAASLACVLLFVSANKVFSSQYMIWFAGPVLFLMFAAGEGTDGKTFRLYAAGAAATQIAFAYNCGYLGGGEAIDGIGMAMILARNILALALLAAVFRAFPLRVSRPSSLK